MMKDGFVGLKKDVNTAAHFLRLTHKISKAYIPILIVSSIFKALTPFINIIMPKYIIDELIGQKRIQIFIVLVLITIVGNFILNAVNRWLDTITSIKNIEVVNGFKLLMGKKMMEMDFENVENPEVLDLKERAIFPIETQHVIEQMINQTISIFTNFTTIIGLIAVMATLDLYVILIILFIVILNSFINKKTQKIKFEFPKLLTPLNRAADYYDNVVTDFSCGKDVRLYNLSPLIMGKIKEYNRTSLSGMSKLFKSIWRYNGLSKINLQIQMAVIYGYMTYKVVSNDIGIGSFAMYVSSANKFSNTISDFISNFMTCRQMCKYLEEYLKLEQIKSINIEGYRKIQNLKEFNIEFKNVYFKYPRSKEYTLKNVSIVIKNGEKLSVVGLNGAGKTTFIKLLTRLYEPIEGEILLNGVNIRKYDYEEYMNLLSVVFQDFKLMAFTVKENIALKDYEISKDEDVKEALKKGGIEKDVLKLPKGINTYIYKTFVKDGIEFSGGQAQKLAISRAAYKNAPIVVLDEPTAALDPIAEFEIYNRFNSLLGEKTAIYISHRLSSCKFCDKIAVFHKGEIIQYGTHEELIKEQGGQYGTLYMAQAQYYI